MPAKTSWTPATWPTSTRKARKEWKWSRKLKHTPEGKVQILTKSKIGPQGCKRWIIRKQSISLVVPSSQKGKTSTLTTWAETYPRCTSCPADGSAADGNTCRLIRKSITSSITQTESTRLVSNNMQKAPDVEASSEPHSTIQTSTQLSIAKSEEKVTRLMVDSLARQGKYGQSSPYEKLINAAYYSLA